MPVQRELITMTTFGIDTSASDTRADSISRSFCPYPFSHSAELLNLERVRVQPVESYF